MWIWAEKLLTRGFTEPFIGYPHPASWYMNICFSSFVKNSLDLRFHTCSESLFFCVCEWVQRLVQRGSRLYFYIWSDTLSTSVLDGHAVSLELFVLLAPFAAVLETHGSLMCPANCIFYIVSYLGLLKSSVNSFTSGETGEDSTSSTLLRTVWV